MRTTTTVSTIIVLAVSALAAGCGSDDSDGKSGSQGPAGPAGLPGDPGDPGALGPTGPAGDAGVPPLTDDALACADIDLVPPADGQGVQIGISAFFSAYYESEQCKFIRVPDEGWNFNGQEIKYTVGSHHVIVHRTSYHEIPSQLVDGTPFFAEEDQIFDCGAKRGGVNSMFETNGVFAGSQNPEWAPQRFPSDTAIKIEGGTYVIINAHFLNPTPEGLHTCTKLNLYTIPDADVKRQADLFFWYNPFLSVPANGQSNMTATGTIPVDIEIIGAVQSHMHSRGASYVAKLNDPSGAFIQNLFETTDWETPTPLDFPQDSPLLVKAGSTIAYTCNYTNAENRVVHQGLETSDEMCMFVGVYRPVNPADSTPALHDALYSLTQNAFFDLAKLETGGKTACETTVQCFLDNRCSEDPTQAGCDDNPDGILSNGQQQCMTDSCYPTEALAYLRCAGSQSGTCATSCQSKTAMPLYQSQCTASCSSTQTQALADCQAAAKLAEFQAKCSTATPMAAYQAACATTCAADCTDPTAAVCTDCVTACVTGKVTACVTEKVTACVTEMVTPCVTDCVVGKVTACAQECLQGIECKTQWDACKAGTTCS